MILIHNGTALSVDVERNIITSRKYGLDAICIFRKGSYKEGKDGRQVIHHWHNLTQVHLGYEHMLNKRDRIAFESDIHCAGGWRLIDEIDMVIIHNSTKMFDTVCESKYLSNNEQDSFSFVKFFEGKVPDYKGRFLDEILDYSPTELESVHDYIQVIFPLKETSFFNPDACLITDDDIDKINNSSFAKAGAYRAIYTMLFYYMEQSDWATHYNHNLLRITRMIKFIHLIFGTSNAKDILKCIMLRCKQLNFQPNKKTLEFWNMAVEGNTPDTENDTSDLVKISVKRSPFTTK